MSLKRPSLPPTFEVPPRGADQPAWAKVGLIAAFGFGIGMVWPKLAGLQLGPNPPLSSLEAKNAASSLAARASAGNASLPPLGSASLDSTTTEETVTVSAGVIHQCRDAKGGVISSCDPASFDGALVAPLKNLSKCPSALGLTGKLAVGFEMDFRRKQIHVQRGKSSTLPPRTLDGVMKCLEASLGPVSLDGVAHEHTHYTVVYQADFSPPGKVPVTTIPDNKPPIPGDDTGSGGAAMGNKGEATAGQIVWNSCLVREKAEKTSAVVGRLTHGAKVMVLSQQGEWRRVQFGDGSKEGWVFHEALGL